MGSSEKPRVCPTVRYHRKFLSSKYMERIVIRLLQRLLVVYPGLWALCWSCRSTVHVTAEPEVWGLRLDLIQFLLPGQSQTKSVWVVFQAE